MCSCSRSMLRSRCFNEVSTSRLTSLLFLPAQHPNVVRYFGTVLEKPHYALILEFCCVPAIWEGAAPPVCCALACLGHCLRQQLRGN